METQNSMFIFFLRVSVKYVYVPGMMVIILQQKCYTCFELNKILLLIRSLRAMLMSHSFFVHAQNMHAVHIKEIFWND